MTTYHEMPPKRTLKHICYKEYRRPKRDAWRPYASGEIAESSRQVFVRSTDMAEIVVNWLPDCVSGNRLSLWSHCISIWPTFYADIHGRQRQNKQMRFSKWRRSQWRRAAPTCTDIFPRLTVETKSFCFFRPCMPVCGVGSC